MQNNWNFTLSPENSKQLEFYVEPIISYPTRYIDKTKQKKETLERVSLVVGRGIEPLLQD